VRTEEIIQEIRKDVESFNNLCKEYLKIKQDIEKAKAKKDEMEKRLRQLKPLDQRKKELLREAWRIETQETQADRIAREINQLNERIRELQRQKDGLQERILEAIIDLRFPLDPDSIKMEENYYCISSVEGVSLTSEAYNVISEVLDFDFPLKINKVTLGPDVWKVRAKSQEEALEEIINAIRTIREQAKFRKKVFSELDTFCKRIHKSERYRQIMLLLVSHRRLLPKEVAAKMGLRERVAYDACYNLTRSSLWNPPPVKRERDGSFTLTTFGNLVMQRYMELYGVPSELKEKSKKQVKLG